MYIQKNQSFCRGQNKERHLFCVDKHYPNGIRWARCVIREPWKLPGPQRNCTLGKALDEDMEMSSVIQHHLDKFFVIDTITAALMPRHQNLCIFCCYLLTPCDKDMRDFSTQYNTISFFLKYKKPLT